MRTDRIFVVGAGGHAKVVVDALLAGAVERSAISITDDQVGGRGHTLLGIPVGAPALQSNMAGTYFHVAIGNGASRARLHAQLLALGAIPLTVLHPRSSVSPHARLGAAVFVAAGAVVGPDALLGDGVIVNHGAVVDHDCRLDAFSHVAPNATLGGGVSIGAGAMVGAGANILPGRQIGAAAVVGAGAVVLQDVMAGHTCVGVPAVSKEKGIK